MGDLGGVGGVLLALYERLLKSTNLKENIVNHKNSTKK